jgi:hypothetical protein
MLSGKINKICFKEFKHSLSHPYIKPVIKYFVRENAFLVNIYRPFFEEKRPSFITRQHSQACYQVLLQKKWFFD